MNALCSTQGCGARTTARYCDHCAWHLRVGAVLHHCSPAASASLKAALHGPLANEREALYRATADCRSDGEIALAAALLAYNTGDRWLRESALAHLTVAERACGIRAVAA